MWDKEIQSKRRVIVLKTFKRRFVTFVLGSSLALMLNASTALANDLDNLIAPSKSPAMVSVAPPMANFSATSFSEVLNNPDGSYTYRQIVNGSSSAPYYVQPSNGGGFDIYSQFNQDYGWMHDFPDWNSPGLVIQSATLKVKAWDVDSEVWHGWDGEYDGLSVDGNMLNPGYLQGYNGEWSETSFDIPVNSITDDGKINTFLDIDMHHTTPWWLTTVDNSLIEITYRLDGVNNNAPYKPELNAAIQIDDNLDIVAEVTGPNPADPDGDLVHYQYRWFVDVGNGFFVDDEFAGRGNHTGASIPAADTQTGDKWKVQVTPIDEHGSIGPYSETSWEVGSQNQPPIIVADNQVIVVDEGQQAVNTGMWKDLDLNDNVVLTASIGNIEKMGTNATGTWGWNYNAIDGPVDNQKVIITANDGTNQGVCEFSLEVKNVAPVISSLMLPEVPVQVNQDVSTHALFSDCGVLDTHTAAWDWGDGSSSTGNCSETDGSGAVSGNHKYAAPGVYTVMLNITDKDGASTSAFKEYIVVYDPAGGFVTGGGWINSPKGAYLDNVELEGKANFGFISKYEKGASVPNGQTEFQFKVGDLNFHSTSYDWLVIAGAKAQYKGTGTINGTGEYGFMLTGIDGQLKSSGSDMFRIKIWNKASGEVVYDNQIGTADNAEPSTEIAGGNIVIHKD